RKDLRLGNAMEDSILERNRENLPFKLSWMLLLLLPSILHFSPQQIVHGQDFDELPTDEDIESFLKDLGYTGEIKTLNDVVIDQMHQPWRTFDALINRSLSGKTTGLDKLRLS
ncbi:hypothetical protein Tco_0029148, partial [Tanacetum coccineum]